MFGLWLSVALAADPGCDPTVAISSLRAAESLRTSYLCLADHADGGMTLVRALEALRAAPAAKAPLVGTPEELTVAVTESDTAIEARYTRALALWLLCHADAAWEPTFVARLSPADRRLLADGVHALRGRKSPSPEHDAVFAQFAWYRVNPKYTDNLLSATDRANIDLANRPPPPPAPPPPVEAAASPTVAPPGSASPPPAAEGTPADTGLCGCASSPGATPLLGLLAALALRRARR